MLTAAGSDRRAARTAAFGVLLVAVTAAVISFSHVRALAMRAGETELTSWLLPVSIDGAVVAAVSVLLADSRAGRRPAMLTWLLLGLGLCTSLAANVASVEPTATARAVSAWPPVALALGIEVLSGLVRREEGGAVHADAAAAGGMGRHENRSDMRTPPAENGRAAGGGSKPLPVRQEADAAGSGSNERVNIDDADAVRTIQRLDVTDPTGRVSRLEIQKALGCGGSRAARLAALARQGDELGSR